MNFLTPIVQFVVQLGYFGPFVMGILDSSFLVLPFGNDLLVVGLVARHHGSAAWYIVSAAAGSTLGLLMLAIVARKLGEQGLHRITGKERYEKLKSKIGNRGGKAIALAAIAPPPFPYSPVIAAVAAVDYPIWRMAVINFVARGLRFTALALLSMHFGKAVLGIVHSPVFQWSMIAFIAFCAVASAYSIWHWMRRPRRRSAHA